MDKKLFFGATFLLALEIFWLLADMNIIYVQGITQDTSIHTRRQIGTVEERRSTLKRRYLDSIVWEDTNKDDALYFLDSVLTLDQSSAVLRLDGNTQLALSENTLVVLERSSDDKVDQLKVRFSRGDIKSRNPDRAIAVDASTWTVEVEKGSDISLRTKDSENLELEVRKGKVKVKEENQTEPTEFGSGDVVNMTKTELDHKKIDDSLVWKTPFSDLNLIRKYSHIFPVLVRVEWSGSPATLNWEAPDGVNTKLEITEGQQFVDLTLQKGLHHLRLNGVNSTSSVLPIEVWKAPEIHTFWPLPRDRFVMGTEVPFSWSKIDGVHSYQLQFLSEGVPALSKPVENRNNSKETPNIEGPYDWTVEGVDELGFYIPYYYRSPIFFLKNPLAPPVLEKPEFLDDTKLRKPASDKLKSSWINWMSLFVSQAHADGFRALFRWQNVEGAQKYIVEIDDEPNFKTPLVQVSVEKTEYLWENFKLNTYYWRVAAEGKNGEMGLFSTVATVDLNNPAIFTPKPEDLAPPKQSASQLRQKPKERPPSQTRESREEEIKSEPPEPEPPAPTPVVQKRKRPIDAPSRGFSGSVWWTPTYEISQGSGTGNFKTNFNGYYLMALSTRFDFPVDEDFTDVTVKLSYRQTEYKPKPLEEYPFQKTLSRSNIRASGYYGDNRYLRWGLRSSTFQNFKRKGYEQIDSEESFAFGPSMFWPMSTHLEFETSLLAASQSYLFEMEFRYLFHLGISRSINIDIGSEVEGRYIFGEFKDLQLFPKIFLGLSW